MINRKVRIVVACGAGIAQSSLLKVTLQDIMKEKKVPIDINHCTTQQVAGKLTSFDPDFVIITGPAPCTVPDDCHYMSGLPLFTGVGQDEMIAKMMDIIENDITKA